MKRYWVALVLFAASAFAQNGPKPNQFPTVLVNLTVGPTVAAGQPMTGTVILNNPAGPNTVVGLAADPVGSATLPDTIVIPAGQTQATFPVVMKPGKATTFLPEMGMASQTTIWANYKATLSTTIYAVVSTDVPGASIPPAPQPERQGLEEGLSILPWNGHNSALSLTFDDALPAHYEVAAPALLKRHLKATFYLTSSDTIPNVDQWKTVAKEGFEIGNHTVNHLAADTETESQLHHEYTDAKIYLEKNIGVAVTTLAYPYSIAPDAARKEAANVGFAARDWDGNDEADYMSPHQQIDWFNIPSRATGKTTTADDVSGWIEADRRLKSWLVLQIHGIHEGGFDPMPMDSFLTLLDEAQKAQDDGSIWVASFHDVVAYWRAQSVVESASYDREMRGGTYSWVVPPFFPTGVLLKLHADKGIRLYQGNKMLKVTKEGVYLVRFDQGSLTVIM